MLRRLSRKRALLYCALVCFLVIGSFICTISAKASNECVNEVNPCSSLSEQGSFIYSSNSVTMCLSTETEGCVWFSSESEKRLKVRITNGQEDQAFDMDNDGSFEALPIQMGDGLYCFEVFEQRSGSQYQRIFQYTYSITLQDEYGAYLCPNRYVWYDENSNAVKVASSLCNGLSSDYDKFQTICSYITQNIRYNNNKAFVQLVTYVPDVDAVLACGTGRCFDFASLTAAMLRSQGIYTQLVVGNADNERHAWNRALIDGEWIDFDLTTTANDLLITTYVADLYY